jgi:hypothetical protein
VEKLGKGKAELAAIVSDEMDESRVDVGVAVALRVIQV